VENSSSSELSWAEFIVDTFVKDTGVAVQNLARTASSRRFRNTAVILDTELPAIRTCGVF
jgi:hypothetical protein